MNQFSVCLGIKIEANFHLKRYLLKQFGYLLILAFIFRLSSHVPVRRHDLFQIVEFWLQLISVNCRFMVCCNLIYHLVLALIGKFMQLRLVALVGLFMSKLLVGYEDW